MTLFLACIIQFSFAQTQVQPNTLTTYTLNTYKANHLWSEISVEGGTFSPSNTTKISMGVNNSFKITWGAAGIGKIKYTHKIHSGRGSFSNSYQTVTVTIGDGEVDNGGGNGNNDPDPIVYDYNARISIAGLTGPATVDIGAPAKFTIAKDATYYTLALSEGQWGSSGSSQNGGSGFGTDSKTAYFSKPGKVTLTLVKNYFIPGSRGSFNRKTYRATITVTDKVKNPELSLINASTLCASQSYTVSANSQAFDKYEWRITQGSSTQTKSTTSELTTFATGSNAVNTKVQVRGYIGFSNKWTTWVEKTFVVNNSVPSTPILSGDAYAIRNLENTYTSNISSAKSFSWRNTSVGSSTGSATVNNYKVKTSSTFNSGYVAMKYRTCNAWSTEGKKNISLDTRTPSVSINYTGSLNNRRPSTYYNFSTTGKAAEYEWRVSGDASIYSKNGASLRIRTYSTGNFSSAKIELRAKNHGAWSAWKSVTINVDKTTPSVSISGSSSRDYCTSTRYSLNANGNALEYDWKISGNGYLTSKSGGSVKVNSKSSGYGDIVVSVRGRRYYGWSSWKTVRYSRCGNCSGGQGISIANSAGENIICRQCPFTTIKVGGPTADSYRWYITDGFFASPDYNNTCSNYTQSTAQVTDNNVLLAVGKYNKSTARISVTATYCDYSTKTAYQTFDALYCNGAKVATDVNDVFESEIAPSLYPNPVTQGQDVFINALGIEQVIIVDLIGRTFTPAVTITENQIQIATQDLPRSAYQVRLVGNEKIKNLQFKVD